ncbi:MAG TPA: immunoglobulin domain-containing protein [Chitinispirillaceae bacterium]|nr:immunoglobulin domain-containing protein [Chitinispirillaceae bacterium]
MRIHFLRPGIIKYFYVLLLPLLFNCYVERNNPFDPHGTNPFQPPSIVKQPSVDILSAGQSTTLSVQAEGVGVLRYQWQKNNTNIPGAITAYYTIPSVAITNNMDIYRCIISNNAGSDTSTAVQLDILPNTPGIVCKISAGSTHSLILKNNHSLWGFGYNFYCQLGDGTKTNHLTPVKLMDNVQSISAGQSHSLILKIDGSAWACGHNANGQLGNGSLIEQTTPVKVMDSISHISAGADYSMFLKNDGSLWVCGNNYYGQLGDGTTINRSFPIKIMSSVKTMSARGLHSLILKHDGSLWVCGNNAYGQLGDGTTTKRLFPIQILTGVRRISAGFQHSLVIKDDNSLWTFGLNNYGQLGNGNKTNSPLPVKVMDGVKNIAAGDCHSFIIKNDGSTLACGQNSYGQLGDSSNTDRQFPVKVLLDNIIGISAGTNHSLFLRYDGSSWACGNNNSGQIGDGTTVSRSTPVLVGKIIPVIQSQPLPVTVAEGLTATFRIAATGDSLKFQWQKNNINIPGANDSIYTTAKLTLAESGTVYRCIISNSAGTLISNSSAVTVITAKMYSLTTAVMGNGTVTPSGTDSFLVGTVINITASAPQYYRFDKWIGNATGTSNPLNVTISSNLNITASFVPIIPSILKNIKDTTIYEGQIVTLSVITEGAELTYQWQKNGSPIPGATDSIYNIPAVTLGNNGDIYTCIVSNSSSSITSQKATLSVTKNPAPVILFQPLNKSVIEGQSATFSVSADGSNLRFQWQKNGSPIPGATDSTYKTPVTTMANNGELYNCVVSNNYSSVICSTAVLKVNSKFTNISAGGNHSLFLKSDNSVWACGANVSGQLGDGTTTNRLKIIKMMDSVRNISAGYDHSLMLKTDGSLWACGANGYGQLGDGTVTSRLSPVKIMDNVKNISAGSSFSLILRTDGSLWACGANGVGNLGVGDNTSRSSPVKVMDDVQDVSAGNASSLILKTDGFAWICGIVGQPSSDKYNIQNYPLKIEVENVIGISCSEHCLILKSNGTVWSFGKNGYGQLGNGVTDGKWVFFHDYGMPYQIETENVKNISAGGNHSLALKSDGTAWAWGNNNYGQLGNGTLNMFMLPVRIDIANVQVIAAGSNHSLLLKTDGTVWACGHNGSGQLGNGSIANSKIPGQVLP